MPDFIQGSQLRRLALGSQVINGPFTPPASGSSSTLFTVAGGAVLVTSLLGRVTTALSGTTGAISLGSHPTVGTDEPAGIATAGVVGGAEIGTWVGPVAASTGLAGALTANIVAGNTVYATAPFVVNAGTIEVKTTVATMTGAITWYLTYVPLDTGASVS
jgi:hypothetical protein